MIKADDFYGSITSIELVDTCTSINVDEWNSYMDGTKKASYRECFKLIKRLAPEHNWLTWKNPYKYQCVRKEGLIVIVHSAIEYFFKVS